MSTRPSTRLRAARCSPTSSTSSARVGSWPTTGRSVSNGGGASPRAEPEPVSSPLSPNHPAVAASPLSPALEPELATQLPADDAVHAAIDIGTNSIHLLVARSTPSQRFEVLAQEKEVVRLGHGTGDMTLLADDAMERGLAALRRFRQVADIWDADITAVATSAVREAENHDVFIRRARVEAGIEVEIISGVEEARLI